MTRSMTGYGLGESRNDLIGIKIEIKTFNHRYFDAVVKMPRQLSGFEERIKKYAAIYLSRGRIEIYVNFTNEKALSGVVVVDESLLNNYAEVMKNIGLKYPWMKQDISVHNIASFPDVIKVEAQTLDNDEAWTCLENALNQAVAGVVSMRKSEGANLNADLRLKLENVKSLCSDVSARAPLVVTDYKERLKTRLAELLDQAVVDEMRLAMEVAYFADRCSIDEELTRMDSHIQQFTECLDSDDPIGRKLDFLVQEMNREINTIGAKSNDMGITRNIVELKSEIEKIREQVQNIE